jgi:osmotically inducible lipoprotein OsmB
MMGNSAFNRKTTRPDRLAGPEGWVMRQRIRMRMMRVLNRRAGLIALIGAALALAGCGSSENTGDRAGGGALVGAGSGAAIGAIFGGVGALPGALIGAGVGAGTSVATTDKQVNLGTPVWERR